MTGSVLPAERAASTPVRALLALASFLGIRHRGRKPQSQSSTPKMPSSKLTCVKKVVFYESFSGHLARLASLLSETTQALISLTSDAFYVWLAEFNHSGVSGSKAADHASPLANASFERAFLQPGSWYQNAYMSSLNGSGVPVSSVLRITSANGFEMKVKQLDSLDGGSQGWVIFRSAFDVEPIPGKPSRMRLHLRHDKSVKTLEYEDQLFHMGVRFMLGTLRSASCLLMSAFALEVDIEKHEVYCGPRAGILQKFWQKTVRLDLKEEKDLWTFEQVKPSA